MSTIDAPKNPVNESVRCGICKKNNFKRVGTLDFFYCPVCDRNPKTGDQ